MYVTRKLNDLFVVLTVNFILNSIIALEFFSQHLHTELKFKTAITGLMQNQRIPFDGSSQEMVSDQVCSKQNCLQCMMGLLRALSSYSVSKGELHGLFGQP